MRRALPNIADAIAWAEGIEYLSSLGMEQVREHEIQLTRYALNALKNVQNLKVYGPDDPALKGGVAAFSLEGIHPHDIGTALDQFGVAVRGGPPLCAAVASPPGGRLFCSRQLLPVQY